MLRITVLLSAEVERHRAVVQRWELMPPSTGIDRPVVLRARWDAATAAMSPGSAMSRDGLLSKPGGPGSSYCAG